MSKRKTAKELFYSDPPTTNTNANMKQAGIAAGILAGSAAGRSAGQNLSYDLPGGYSAPGELLCSAALGLVGGIASAAIGGLIGGALDNVTSRFHW